MGQPKLLLRWQGTSLVRHAVKTAVEGGGEPVIVVTGPRHAEMRHEVHDLAVHVVHNPDYAAGMSTSLRSGLAALPEESAAALIMLADQPLITPSVVQALIGSYRETGAVIVQPRYAGQPGNPVLFDRSVFPELMEQSGDQGGREVVRCHRDGVQYVDFDRDDFQRDVDTPDDYAALSGTAAPESPHA